ncbi:MAG TPA: DnaB-like helicase C-terminal domain-containing protein [Candidatus Binatia bacterium]|nr:DnaB-like helicase C-terminal domain-containing protein [Candidatus Binatia bacterium]
MLPKNKQAERAIIGSILIDSGAIRTAGKYLLPEMFYHQDARACFEAAIAIHAADHPCDVVTVGDEIRKTAHPEYALIISQCIDSVVSSEHAEYYSKIVAACHYEREIINQATLLVTIIYQSGDPQATLNKIRELVLTKESLTASMTFDYHTDLVAFFENIGNKTNAATNKTGYEIIDSAWSGTRAGEINVWGAAPNVGKSLMLLNLMNRIAPQGRKCLYVGTEMTAYETTERHLAIVSGMSATRIRMGNIDMADISVLHDAITDKMLKMPISILDKPEPNLQQIEAAINSTKAQVVFLDYLERFKLPQGENMRLRVKEFMREIKSMARRCSVEIHLASQLNRTTYGTVEKRPSLADLSESSAVEKEADRVMLLWRPRAKQTSNGFAIIECIQAKGRQNNYSGTIDLRLSLKDLSISEMETFN